MEDSLDSNKTIIRKNASEQLDLVCIVDSFPIKRGVWNLSDIPIQGRGYQLVSSNSVTIEPFSIPRLRLSDTGKYTCCLNDSSECKSIDIIVEGIISQKNK